ncbi:Glutathione transferase [Purpureocillium takamizusanense]|uniref:Glutathione transferase n=1 Tax=Purpureocillium takamizusanense TaxID=2060973 RepID=A0A9Q8QKG7_9HYPO|nr:Glutathione transferase [Purpureocillium takamizusanense]UNI21255.1 Glutathione transferase [Purpureocillium takamizusanense]
MYALYIGNKRYSSWSMRPWVLLRALDIPFDEKLHFFKPGQAQPEFKAFSPSAKVPCLHDTDTNTNNQDNNGNGVVVWDSLAIAEYLAERHPGVWPSDRAARAFARCAAAEMHSSFAAVRDECSMNVALRIELPRPLSEPLRRDLARLGALFAEGLERFGGPYLAGAAFTAADAFFAPVASRCQTYGIRFDDEPRAQAYVDALLAHPAVRAWIEQGIRETEREPYHEEDCVRGRKVLEDLAK